MDACLLCLFGLDADVSANRPINEEEAFWRVWTLPKVIEWAERVRRLSHGEASPMAYLENSPDRAKPLGNYRAAWIFYLGEDHKTHTTLWRRFRVDAVSGKVSLWEPATDAYLPMSPWRMR